MLSTTSARQEEPIYSSKGEIPLKLMIKGSIVQNRFIYHIKAFQIMNLQYIFNQNTT